MSLWRLLSKELSALYRQGGLKWNGVDLACPGEGARRTSGQDTFAVEQVEAEVEAASGGVQPARQPVSHLNFYCAVELIIGGQVGGDVVRKV